MNGPSSTDADRSQATTSLLTAPDANQRQRLARALGDEYELGELLGAGGFAEVYAAWDRRLKRDVAVKVLRREHDTSEETLQRFRREAEAIAQLRHPNIVPIYAVGESQGLAWFVMPRIQGESLDAVLARGDRWSFAEAIRVLREAASALDVAHAAGIVHRDIKPANIMLEGADRRVVLMDFGIAKSSAQASIGSGLTGTGMVLGTPQYMSPEQMAGDPEVGPATDQYALGLVGYRLLTGRQAFEADTFGALMMMHASQPPTPVRELRADVPAALASVVERTLEKDPERRFATVAEFGAALERAARDVAGEFRRGRRMPPIAERVADARRRTLQLWAWARWVIAAGLVAGVGASVGSRSAVMKEIIRKRDDATFGARVAARAFGIGDRPGTPAFGVTDQVYQFLQGVLGADSLDRVAAKDYAVWRWSFLMEDSVGAGGIVDVNMADGKGRVVRIGVADTAGAATGRLAGGDARRLADSVVRAMGDDPATLTLLSVDSTLYPKYTSWFLRWRVPGRTIVRGGDTASVLVQVRISGQRPTLYTRLGRLARASTAPVTPQRQVILVGLMPGLLLALGIFAILVVVRRASIDVLQWRMGLLITLPALVSWFGIATVTANADQLSVQFLLEQVATVLPVQLCVWLLTAIAVVGAESLLYDARPDVFAGTGDVTAGRLRFPEITPAAVAGYALGLGFWGGICLVMRALTVTHLLDASPTPLMQLSFAHPFPALVVLLPLALALGFTGLAGFAGAAFQRRRNSVLMLMLVPPLLTVALLYDVVPLYQLVGLAVLMSQLPLLSMRFGFVASVIAITVQMGAPTVYEMIDVGGPYLLQGVLAGALLLVPAFAALSAWRRQVIAGKH